MNINQKELIDVIYTLFNIDKNTCTLDDVKKSYRKLSYEFHTDRHPDIDPSVFVALAKMYDIVIDNINSNNNQNTSTNINNNSNNIDFTDQETIDQLSNKLIRQAIRDCIINQISNIDVLTVENITNIIENAINDDTIITKNKIDGLRGSIKKLEKIMDLLPGIYIEVCTKAINNHNKSIVDLKNKIKINNNAILILQNINMAVNSEQL